ncbi:MAG: hypothetical protein JO149_04510 [Gammaproteobacteria bacterium]|nr:hypothetical protein [Gammaproteobacteria bacterium]
MENFNILLKKIQLDELRTFALGALDKFNAEEMHALAAALIKNNSINTIIISSKALFKGDMNDALFNSILEKMKYNDLTELSFMFSLDEVKMPLFLNALQQNSSLIKLTLADGILNTNMPLLSKVVKSHKTLRHLNLDSNFAKDISIPPLCDLLRDSAIESLSLQNNHFSAEGMKLLLENNQSLVTLNLNNNPGSEFIKKFYGTALEQGFFYHKKETPPEKEILKTSLTIKSPYY